MKALAIYDYKQQDDGTAEPRYIEIDLDEWEIRARLGKQAQWKRNHPGEVWILEQVQPSLLWVTDRCAISPVKTFRNKDRAEKWLDDQGADWLWRKDWDWLQACKKARRAA